MDLLASSGWKDFNFHRLAKVMGTSEQPIRNRVRDIEELAALTWKERLASPLRESLEVTLSSSGRESLPEAIAPLLRRTPTNFATAELLVLSKFLPALHEEVDQSLGIYLRELIPSADEKSARNAFTISLALGLLMMGRHPESDSWDLTQALATRSRALATGLASHLLPDVEAPHMDIEPALAPEDPALQALLGSCLDLVALYGFDSVTVRQIARKAGYTEGLIYARYAGKLDLFRDAVRRQNQAGWRLNREFVQDLEVTFGPGVSQAIQWQQYQRPQRAAARALALEQLRMSWHDRDLMRTWVGELDAFRATLLRQPGWSDFETDADFILNVAVPLGLYLLPTLVPHVDRLPYEVVTIPLFAAFDLQSHRAKHKGSAD